MKAPYSRLNPRPKLMTKAGVPRSNLLLFPAIADERSAPVVEQRVLLEMILRLAPDAIIACDRSGKITLVNTAAKLLSQKNPAGTSLQQAPAIWGRLFDGNGRSVSAKQWPWMKALRGKTVIRQEYRLVRADGTSADVLFSAVPLTGSGKIAGVVASITDLTHHKGAELMLRQQCVDRERSRMAADIHDTLSQSLNAIVLQLKAAMEEIPNQLNDARLHLLHAHDAARDCLAQARRSMWTFSQQPFEGEDLAALLSSAAEQLFSATAVTLQLQLDGSAAAVSSDVRCALQRIAKEALCNTLRHAQATEVRMHLTYRGCDVELQVIDDGVGFRSGAVSGGRRGLGLVSMQERAERLGGKFVIKSRPGQGTRIFASIPLSPFVQTTAA